MVARPRAYVPAKMIFQVERVGKYPSAPLDLSYGLACLKSTFGSRALASSLGRPQSVRGGDPVGSKGGSMASSGPGCVFGRRWH
jgi:hypothetical protein